MSKGILLGLVILAWSGLAYAEAPVAIPEPAVYHSAGNAPLLEPYHYKVTPNSWYLAKIKPKWQMRAKIRTDDAQAPTAPPAVAAPPTPVRKIRHVTKKAVPFWRDIAPKPGQ